MGLAQALDKGRTVSQFMTIIPICADVTATVQDVADILFAADVRHIPVVDDDERLLGMFSDRDLRAVVGGLSGSEQREVLRQPIVKLLETDIFSVAPEDDILMVIDLMLYHKIGAVPVVDPNTDKLIGIVSYIDVLQEVRLAIA